MEQLVRTTLELEQFECEKCGRFVYINKMDLDDLKAKNPDKVVIPDCPFDCWADTKHRRTIITKVTVVINKEPRPCAQCGEHFIPDSQNVMMCEECFPKLKDAIQELDFWIQELKKVE